MPTAEKVLTKDLREPPLLSIATISASTIFVLALCSIVIANASATGKLRGDEVVEKGQLLRLWRSAGVVSPGLAPKARKLPSRTLLVTIPLLPDYINSFAVIKIAEKKKYP